MNFRTEHTYNNDPKIKYSAVAHKNQLDNNRSHLLTTVVKSNPLNTANIEII